MLYEFKVTRNMLFYQFVLIICQNILKHVVSSYDRCFSCDIEPLNHFGIKAVKAKFYFITSSYHVKTWHFNYIASWNFSLYI